MGRKSTIAAVIAGCSLLAAISSARATCFIPTAGYTGGQYGVDAVADNLQICSSSQSSGGTGVGSASVSVNVPAGVQPGGTASATAGLATGVLTAYASAGAASSSEWDTFTFSGLPSGGSTVTVTLSLAGSLTGLASGNAQIQVGAPGTIMGSGSVTQSAFFNPSTGIPLPPDISLGFTAMDNTPVTIFAQIFASVGYYGGNGIADLLDPPTLTITLPVGVTASTASGLFDNFDYVSAVAAPGDLGLFLFGLGLCVALSRRRKQPIGNAV